MKLSKRLQTIEKLVTQHYDHIWDCCCDHGFLGMTLLQR
ncbi:SAM-dependent methyltransferase, partial [Vibrio furnissii]